MNDFHEVTRLVRSSSITGRAMQELQQLFGDNVPVQQLSHGMHTAKDAQMTYEIRRQTAEKADVDVWCLDDLLVALNALPASCAIRVFHYGTTNRLFSVFITDWDNALLACISTPRRNLESES